MNEDQIKNLLYTIYSAGFNHGNNESSFIPEHGTFDAFNRLLIGESPMLDDVRYGIKEDISKLFSLTKLEDTSKDIKRIDIKEFRESGYLQELNRRFLHPLGLALEVMIDDEGNEKLGGIWDSRDEKDGIYYDISNSDLERKQRFNDKKLFIDGEFKQKLKDREEILGFGIEPI